MKKSKRFTESEKKFILQAIDRYKVITDNKKRNSHMANLKKETWNSIVREFNLVNESGVRSAEQIKKFYENYKRRCKQLLQCKENLSFHENSVESNQTKDEVVDITEAKSKMEEIIESTNCEASVMKDKQREILRLAIDLKREELKLVELKIRKYTEVLRKLD